MNTNTNSHTFVQSIIGPSRLPRGPRSVAFNSRTRVVPHLHLNDMTSAEIHSSFISREDIAAMQHDLVKDIQTMRDGGVSSATDSDIDHCFRGLEISESVTSIEMARASKLRTLDAVMDEQDRQDVEGFYGEGLLAKASIDASQRSVDMAVMRGASDEICARLQDAPVPSRQVDLCASGSPRRRFSDMFQKSYSLKTLAERTRSSSMLELIPKQASERKFTHGEGEIWSVKHI